MPKISCEIVFFNGTIWNEEYEVLDHSLKTKQDLSKHIRDVFGEIGVKDIQMTDF